MSVVGQHNSFPFAQLTITMAEWRLQLSRLSITRSRNMIWCDLQCEIASSVTFSAPLNQYSEFLHITTFAVVLCKHKCSASRWRSPSRSLQVLICTFPTCDVSMECPSAGISLLWPYCVTPLLPVTIQVTLNLRPAVSSFRDSPCEVA